MTYNDAVEGYLLDRSQDLGRATIHSYQFWFVDFGGWLNHQPQFSQITTQQIARYFQHLQNERNLADATRLRAWAVLSSLWTWAERTLGTPHVLRGKVSKPVAPKSAIEPYTEDEIKALVKAAQFDAPRTRPGGNIYTARRPTAKRDIAIILTLVDCGLRASELCALIFADYDKETGRLRIRHGKGNKERSVYLGKTARRALWRYLADRPDLRPDAPLFATTTERHIDRNNLRHMLAAVARNADVQKVHPHRFRHTFAITFLRNGGNVLALQRLLGHERLDTVNIYVKLAQTDLATAHRSASPADAWKL